MDSCLLCLEINEDILDCIKANSSRWRELEIAKTIEKHFWSLENIQPSSWICLSCWREVEGFHKFFLRIEEAHLNFGNIKVENCEMAIECKQEHTIQKLNIKENDEEWDKDNMAFCFLEPEILIDQAQQQEMLIDEPEGQNLLDDEETVINPPLDELDLDMPLKHAIMRFKIQTEVANKDPLEKSKKYKKKKNAKVATEVKLTEDNKTKDLKVKMEPVDYNESNDNSNLDSINDKVIDTTVLNNPTDKLPSKAPENAKNQGCSKQRISRKENDKFISENISEISCDLCQEKFDTFPTLQKHFTAIHNQRGYVVCCERKFFDRTRLVDHLYRHIDPDHFKCNQCGKIMSDRLNFENHMMCVHGAGDVARQHCCDVCGKSFVKASLLRLHKLTHLSEEEKKYHCDDCGKNYGSAYILNQHKQAVHQKRFVKVCYLCGKAISSSGEFKAHMDKHEGIPPPVINCDVCGLRLTSERGLKRHKDSQHPVGGKQEHHCPNCPKISPTLKALKKHINTMHGKTYYHKCSICEKGFKRAESLREHMATHTGTTLYSCPWCPKTFNSNGNFHAHRKKMHPIEWVESKLQKYSGNIPPEI